MSEFTDAIAHNWGDKWTIAPGASRRDCCIEYTGYEDAESLSDEDLQCLDEGSFSWSECDSCGSILGGNRYPAHAIKNSAFGRKEKPGDIYHIEICSDCLMFHANGEEPEDWQAA